MFLAKRFETLNRRIADLEILVERIQGELKSSVLDADELRDQARRMLNRANAQRRWIEDKADKPNGELHPDSINQRILDFGRP